MHLMATATVFVVLSLVGVEFSIAAFVDPAAWRLEPEPQLTILSRLASVLGKVMPFWYPASAVLLGVQTWLCWCKPGRGVLLTADVIWLISSAGSIIFLVPLNTRIAQQDADWQRIHRVWDKGHRVRTAALAIAAFLVTYVAVH
jgi:uncharacterized membrane protein